ncbi:MAG: RecX family transcriptional regulator [Chlorobi bacterium]|nr:RecX family transcriptional regulator [Chlorobiota bacterium]
MLFKKKVPENLINDALSEIQKEKYIETLEYLLKQKRKSIKDEDNCKQKQKLIRFAASRGFEPELILKKLEK